MSITTNGSFSPFCLAYYSFIIMLPLNHLPNKLPNITQEIAFESASECTEVASSLV